MNATAVATARTNTLMPAYVETSAKASLEEMMAPVDKEIEKGTGTAAPEPLIKAIKQHLRPSAHKFRSSAPNLTTRRELLSTHENKTPIGSKSPARVKAISVDEDKAKT